MVHVAAKIEADAQELYDQLPSEVLDVAVDGAYLDVWRESKSAGSARNNGGQVAETALIALVMSTLRLQGCAEALQRANEEQLAELLMSAMDEYEKSRSPDETPRHASPSAAALDTVSHADRSASVAEACQRLARLLQGVPASRRARVAIAASRQVSEVLAASLTDLATIAYDEHRDALSLGVPARKRTEVCQVLGLLGALKLRPPRRRAHPASIRSPPVRVRSISGLPRRSRSSARAVALSGRAR